MQCDVMQGNAMQYHVGEYRTCGSSLVAPLLCSTTKGRRNYSISSSTMNSAYLHTTEAHWIIQHSIILLLGRAPPQQAETTLNRWKYRWQRVAHFVVLIVTHRKRIYPSIAFQAFSQFENTICWKHVSTITETNDRLEYVKRSLTCAPIATSSYFWAHHSPPFRR